MRTGPLRAALFALALPVGVLGNDILKTSGFNKCLDNADIKVESVNVEYNRATGTVSFDVSGSSAKVQNVSASLTVTAYGKEVYSKDFDPCDPATKVDQLCPVPSGNFGARGEQKIPESFADMIPGIAFQIPDLDGNAKLELKSTSGGQNLACIESHVSNGKSIDLPAVSYIAVGITAGALVLSGVSALSAAGGAGGASAAPGFGATLGWFQSMAMNGMLSVDYPPVYRSFSKNFAFSGGLIPWTGMQQGIDSFRASTGGNLTESSVGFLQNVTIVHRNGLPKDSPSLTRRAFGHDLGRAILEARQVATSVNGSAGASGSGNSTDSKPLHLVHGIQGFVEPLLIPDNNTFMTVLGVLMCVIGAIAVGILLFKVILETWALFGSFPKSLTGFRKRYWGILARTIVNLVLLLYGIWTLYCVYQLTHGDSWAAKTLAAVTLAIFTAILGFFTFRIWQLARRYKKLEGDQSALFEDETTWRRYSLFYDQYKKNLWWIFIPTIVYMFVKGCVIAGGEGHGLAQASGQLICEALMLTLLVWNRPYVTAAGNWINIFIQVVRALSVICILVFVEELGMAQTTKTTTGVVLIVVQSVLTAALGILIAVNAIIICCRENPHRKQKKEAEKLNRDLDNLTPLDARNSLLIDPGTYSDSKTKGPLVAEHPTTGKAGHDSAPYRDLTPVGRRPGSRDSTAKLVGSAAGMGHSRDRSMSRSSFDSTPPRPRREPTLPNVGYRGMAY